MKFKRKALDGNMFVYLNRWEGRAWRHDAIRLIDMFNWRLSISVIGYDKDQHMTMEIVVEVG